MDLFSNIPIPLALAIAPGWPSTSELRWQLAAFAIGLVILSFGLAGLSLFLFQRKTADRSLVFFSLFSFLYAIRLIFRQSVVHSLVPAPLDFWKYSDLVIDNFIVIPLTLFIIDVIQGRWKTLLRCVLAFQIAFGMVRFYSQLLHAGERPIEIIYHIVIVAYCALLIAYPLTFSRGQRMPREVKVAYAGFAIFGLFVVWNNLPGPGGVRGLDIEAFGFLALVCCLGYLAAFRTYSNEQRLLSIQKELEIAQQIQSSILPREVPHVAGLDIAARCVPMAAVAGDFYDFLSVDENRVGILIADVTGHGVPAALIASMLKTALAAQSPFACDPAQVVAGLNHSLCGKFEEHFVTAGYLFVDVGKQILRYAGAGHPPLMLGAVDGRQTTFREIDSNGPVLGLLEGAIYSSLELPFRPGDRCMLYTDGIIEARNKAQEEFGSSRFLKFLEAQSHLAPGSLISALLAEVTQWSGKGDAALREDDITVIAVRFQTTSTYG
jgi:serine phosphatase RsbU (regulator of sigma subunit)